MKNRNRQRENRRLKNITLQENPRLKKPWLNNEGYYDPTAYQAIRNIERQERKKTLS